MGNTAVAIATMAAANNAMIANSHTHCHQSNENEGLVVLSLILALIIPCVLWIIYTSIRQYFKKSEYYNFFDENILPLIIIGVFGGITLLILFASFIYTLIK